MRPARLNSPTLYLAWDRKGINVTAGQHKAFTPLDDMTSDLNTSFMERAAIVTAFGHGRRTGVSAGYAKGDFGVNGGVFTDPLLLLNDVQSNSISVDTPRLLVAENGKAKLHFAAAYHYARFERFRPGDHALPPAPAAAHYRHALYRYACASRLAKSSVTGLRQQAYSGGSMGQAKSIG